jgi:hypothetical protein
MRLISWIHPRGSETQYSTYKIQKIYNLIDLGNAEIDFLFLFNQSAKILSKK